jgi:hypothetical protein
MAKKKQEKIKVSRMSDGDTKDITKAELTNYLKQGYRIQNVSVAEVKAVVKKEEVKPKTEEK